MPNRPTDEDKRNDNSDNDSSHERRAETTDRPERDHQRPVEREPNTRETLDELSAGAPPAPGAVIPPAIGLSGDSDALQNVDERRDGANALRPDAAAQNGSATQRRAWRWDSSRRINPFSATIAVVAVVGAIIGGVAAMMLYPYLGSYFAPKPQLPSPSGIGITQTALPNTSAPPSVFVAQKVGPAVVTIINRQQASSNAFDGAGLQGATGGSGVIIDANGYIVTNNHVVESSAGLTVTLADGRNLPASVVGADPASDLAVIKVNAVNLPTADFGDSDKLQVGEAAIAIGNPVDPQAFQRTVTEGIISGVNRQVESGGRMMTLVQTDAAINPGNSGGPLCNAAGQVIAINVAKIAETQGVEGIGLAIPANVARPIINQLISSGKIARVWIGVGTVEKDAAAAYYGVNFDQGLLVAKVYQNSPASGAGIQTSDIMTKADGQALTTSAQLKTILDAKRPGDKVNIELLRAGKTVTVTATLAEQPADVGQ